MPGYSLQKLMAYFDVDDEDDDHDALEDSYNLRNVVWNARPSGGSHGWYSGLLMAGFKSTRNLL